ncbi:MAG: lysophospholipid acyltransferase family protein [Gemmatimonadaceae bacterium]
MGRLGLRLLGWRITGEVPDLPKFVIVVAPHTSNWDFAIAFLAYLALEIRVSWLGKHTIFRFPFGEILRAFGGIPVQRGTPQNVVERAIAEFERHDRFALALAPEGTRRRVQTWRRGFHRIALGAGVPIVAVSLDFSKQEIEIGPVLHTTGDYALDFKLLLDRFADVTPRHPALYDPSPSA